MVIMARKNKDRERTQVKPEDVGTIESLGVTESDNEELAEVEEQPVAEPAPVVVAEPAPTAPKATPGKVKPAELSLQDAINKIVDDDRWKSHWDVALAKHAAISGIKETATHERWKSAISSFGIKTK